MTGEGNWWKLSAVEQREGDLRRDVVPEATKYLSERGPQPH